MKLDTVVTLIILLLNIGTFSGIALLCFMLIRMNDLREVVEKRMPKNPLAPRKKKKHSVVKRTEEQEAKMEGNRFNTKKRLEREFVLR